jgi:hypothetical protein
MEFIQYIQALDDRQNLFSIASPLGTHLGTRFAWYVLDGPRNVVSCAMPRFSALTILFLAAGMVAAGAVSLLLPPNVENKNEHDRENNPKY